MNDMSKSQERHVRLPPSVTHCGFCGGTVTPYDTMYVSLSRERHIGYKKVRADKVGFCVPCCTNCLSFWKRLYAKRIAQLALSFVVVGALSFLALKFLPLPWPLFAFGAGGVALYVMGLVLLRGFYGGGLIGSIGVPWVRELSEDGYAVDVIVPRSAQTGKDTEGYDEKVVRLGHGHKRIEYYTWKGCEHCHCERMTEVVSARASLGVFLCALYLFLYGGGLLAIWIGYILLIVYLYCGTGRAGETSFMPVVISLALAIGASFGFVRLMRLFQPRNKTADGDGSHDNETTECR